MPTFSSYSSHPSLSVISGISPDTPIGSRPETALSLSAVQSVSPAAGALSPLPLDADFGRTWRALGGADARGRLHALHPMRAGDIGAQTGFALTVIAWLAAASPLRGVRRPLLWIQDRHGLMDAGRPYGLGFSGFGVVAADVVVVAVRGTLEALTAAEMGLEAGELAGVLVELPPTLPADMLRLGKRLALRAERARTACFFMHGGTQPAAMPVATRWFVSSAPSLLSPDERSRPSVALSLDKNRFGPTGRWRAVLDLPPSSFSQTEWRHDDLTSTHTFEATHVTSAHPVAVAAAAGDRPAATTGRLVSAA